MTERTTALERELQRCRGYLRMNDGSYCRTEKLKLSWKLREECAEKRVLANIVSKLPKHGMLIDVYEPDNDTSSASVVQFPKPTSD